MAKIYLDACCLNRPYDDQTQERIRLEAEAVLLLLNRFHIEVDHWVSSDVVIYEIGLTPDHERRRRVLSLSRYQHSVIKVGVEEEGRAEALQNLGLKAVDSLHTACAEKAGCDVLLTTDDQLLRAAHRHAAELRVRVMNPVDWLREDENI